jgi:TrpR family trp operon transcriptional repressor
MNNNEKQNEASAATSTISEEMFEQAKNELCKIITTNDEQLVREFCECIFTPAEIKDLVNRWLLVKEIDKGTTQREIARKFGMSLCKITRGSKELSKPDSAFRKVLDTLK